MSTPPPSKPRLYFAYGSNLSLTQMSRRCPTSTYHSLAVLKGWKWIIGERGYANVVHVPSAASSNEAEDLVSSESKSSASDEVYGLLYELEEDDEEALDRAEGVPYCYVKMMLGVTLMGEDGKEGGKREVLVYVDVERMGEGVCKEEYVARMNRGIKDAVERGMPQSYVDDVLRKWVRNEDVPDGEVDDPFFPGGGGGNEK